VVIIPAPAASAASSSSVVQPPLVAPSLWTHYQCYHHDKEEPRFEALRDFLGLNVGNIRFLESELRLIERRLNQNTYPETSGMIRDIEALDGKLKQYGTVPPIAMAVPMDSL